MGVHQWHFYQIRQRFFLLLRQFGAEIRNHAVVAGQQAILCGHGVEFSATHVGNLHFFRRAGVLHMDDGAVQWKNGSASGITLQCLVKYSAYR